MDKTHRRIWAVLARTTFFFIISLRDRAPGILLICSCVPFFIRPKAPTTTGTAVVFKWHFFFFLTISISRSLYLLKHFCRDVFVTWYAYVNQCTNFFFSVFDNNVLGNLLALFNRKTPEDANICSWWCSYQFAAGFHPVVMPDLPIQDTLSWRFFVLIRSDY